MDTFQRDDFSADQFLALIIDQGGRFELVNGQIQVVAETANRHNVVINNVTFALTPVAKANGCRSTTGKTAVKTGGNSVRFPDVVIDCGPPDLNAIAVSNPAILVEVSSPGTTQIDAILKLEEYRNLPTLQIIIQVEPDLVLVGVHRRAGKNGWRIEVYENLDSVIDLPVVNGSLAIRDIYSGLDVKPRPRLTFIRP